MVYNSIADLKAVAIPTDNFANVLGYSTPADGGGGDFYYDATDTTSADDDGTIFTSTASGATGRWKRLYSGALNVKWFGVKGDDSTDDTIKINSAIANLPIESTLFFPSGDYHISGNLNINNKQNIILQADANTIIKVPVTDLSAFVLTACSNVVIDNFNIIGTSLTKFTSSLTAAILMEGCHGCVVSNNKITNYSGHGILLYPFSEAGCTYNTIIRNNITNCYGMNALTQTEYAARLQDASGIMLGYSGGGYFHTDNVIEYNIIDNGFLASHGISLIAHGYNNRLNNNILTNCLSYGVFVYESAYDPVPHDTRLVYNNEIIGNTISNIGIPAQISGGTYSFGSGIYSQKGHRTIITNNRLTEVAMGSNAGSTLAVAAIDVNQGHESIIQNNIINTSGYNGISVSISFGTVVQNNKIYNAANVGVFIHISSDVVIDNNIINGSGVNSILIDSRFTGDTDVANNGIFLPYQNTYSGQNIQISKNTIIQENSNSVVQATGVTTGSGITASDVTGLNFANNKVNSQMYGISLSYCQDSIVENNRFEASSTAAIVISSGTNTDNIKIVKNHVKALAGSITQMILAAGSNIMTDGNTIEGTSSYYINYLGVNYRPSYRAFFGINSMPTTGHYNLGDKIYSSNLGAGYLGFICVAAGTPGTWMPFGRVGTDLDKAQNGTTRPSVTTKGFLFFDDMLGKPIWWNGTGWVDATGATV